MYSILVIVSNSSGITSSVIDGFPIRAMAENAANHIKTSAGYLRCWAIVIQKA